MNYQHLGKNDIFIDNKYTKWYYNIISNRIKSTDNLEYYEEHHIIPKSIGGDNDSENLVKLSAREHLLVHMLLIKMTVGNNRHKMIYALNAMANLRNSKRRLKLKTRAYEYMRKQFVYELSIKMSGDGNQFYGKNHTEETKSMIANALTGKKQKQSTIDKRVESNRGKIVGELNGMYGKNHTQESIDKIVKSTSGELNHFYGKTHTDGWKVKKRQEKLLEPKVLCIYCNKLFDKMNFRRWHDEKCKQYR